MRSSRDLSWLHHQAWLTDALGVPEKGRPPQDDRGLVSQREAGEEPGWLLCPWSF